ncbi:MAG: deoxyribonuclease IV [Phycisphaerae bacterium]
MLLGSHLSIAGGMHTALEKARRFRFDTVAVFVRNQRQWHVPPLAETAVEMFKATRRRLGISPVVAHGSYLVNLAGTEPVRSKSIAAVAADLERCRAFGIEYLVIHPGGNRDVRVGLRLIADALNQVLSNRGMGVSLMSTTGVPPVEVQGQDAPATHGQDARASFAVGFPKILVETTAGAGSILAGTFDQIAEILAQLSDKSRVGVCLDTCHIFAAGYDIRTPDAYARTMCEFDRIIGLANLMAIHLNDSVRELGSHVDRHAHIGKGLIGREGFRNFVNDPRLAQVPMILETPKGIRKSDGRDWDAVNGRAIRSLVRRQL